ncbi:MAG: GGDEF domain-containing protein, partial [Clostridiales bacterium]|nr:GGDEF domain-containing protein [Clostridiales bacterium]
DEEKQSSDEINKQVSISVGTSVFDREKDNSYQEVFERADKNMYENKKRVHEKDGIPTGR